MWLFSLFFLLILNTGWVNSTRTDTANTNLSSNGSNGMFMNVNQLKQYMHTDWRGNCVHSQNEYFQTIGENVQFHSHSVFHIAEHSVWYLIALYANMQISVDPFVLNNNNSNNISFQLRIDGIYFSLLLFGRVLSYDSHFTKIRLYQILTRKRYQSKRKIGNFMRKLKIQLIEYTWITPKFHRINWCF